MIWKITHAPTCKGFPRGVEEFDNEAAATKLFHDCRVGCTMDSLPNVEAPRRERIATACLQGLMADGVATDTQSNKFFTAERTAKMAIEYANALITELDREPERGKK